MKILISFLFITFLFLPRDAHAQIVINEISTSTTSDWVELYFIPTATESADLSIYHIQDSGSYDKELSNIIDPGTYVSFEVGRRFDNDGDIVKLVDVSSGNAVVDSVKYGKDGICAPDQGQTIGRVPDGTGEFKRLFGEAEAKAAPNSTTEATCPTPTPGPTQTPAPTSTPTPAPTKTPTPKPTVLGVKRTLSPSPKPRKFFTPAPLQDLSSRDALKTEEPEPEVLGESDTGSSIIPYIFIILGIGFIGGATYPLWRDKVDLSFLKRGWDNISSGKKDLPED